jgi:hypothetical protein
MKGVNLRPAIPLLIQEGWLRIKKKMRSHRSGADGVVGIDTVFQNAFRDGFLRKVPFQTTPSAPLKEVSRLLIDVASTPPMSGGEWRTQFIRSLYWNNEMRVIIAAHTRESLRTI